MKTEQLMPDRFEYARRKAVDSVDLLELIDWIEIQVSLGVSPTQAAATWAARKSKEPLVKLDSLSDCV
jgi:hypothetical protein